MRFTHAGKSLIRKHALALALALAAVLACATAWAAGPAAAPQAAVWVPKEIKFVYQGFTTTYTCDALREKVKGYLLELGARPDLEVRAYGCTQPTRPDPFAGVSIRMNVLQPAATASAAGVPAHWKQVDLTENRDPARAAGECELIDQIGRKVLPLFATRDVERGSPCEAHNVLPGGTRLKAEVLVPDSTASVAAR
jgi:hypothetical protein